VVKSSIILAPGEDAIVKKKKQRAQKTSNENIDEKETYRIRTPMMWNLVATVLLTTQQLVWTAYPFSFSKRECRDLFPERVGKDSLYESSDVHLNHDDPFIIEPSETIHGIDFSGIQGLLFSFYCVDCRYLSQMLLKQIN
jgi:hypothetical protein